MRNKRIGRDQRLRAQRAYDIKSLWERHGEIVDRIVMGQTNVQIASDLGCTPQTVSNVRNAEVWQGTIERMRAGRAERAMDLGRQIEEFAPVAEQLLEGIIDGSISAPLALRAKYASAHLGRAGFGEVHKVRALHAHLSPDDIARIKERSIGRALEAGIITSGENGANG